MKRVYGGSGKILPTHLTPLPSQPSRQEQWKAPGVLTQVAWMSQLWASTSHSSTSAQRGEMDYNFVDGQFLVNHVDYLRLLRKSLQWKRIHLNEIGCLKVLNE